ncbi:hypothetical protein QA601_07175, partial [Chitinispirillales bacterium ANBcel5]|uniref:hypothetical protein n=1 Tax=Cellulosispirillum alkaliphilum TaxID=3039283 RepID=UPI002A5873BE|nr:hypothetical protein [Chitinispirillales bacterium ANBcel5]
MNPVKATALLFLLCVIFAHSSELTSAPQVLQLHNGYFGAEITDTPLYLITIDDFESGGTTGIGRGWIRVNDASVGLCWNTVQPGNSSTSLSFASGTNPLDQHSSTQGVWSSYIGYQIRKSINHVTGIISDDYYLYSQINTGVNLSGTEGITFQAYSDSSAEILVHLTPGHLEIFATSIEVGPEWNTYTIPYSSFSPHIVFPPSTPDVVPENVDALTFEIGTSTNYDQNYTVIIDNIYAYSSVPIYRQITLNSGQNGTVEIHHIDDAGINALTAHGSIQDTGSIVYDVETRTDVPISIIPDSGFQVLDFVVNGMHYGAVTEFTLTDISNDYDIEAFFIEDSLNIHTITTSTSGSGTITPQGNVSVPEGVDQSFAITEVRENLLKPYLKELLVDSLPVMVTDTFVFENVVASHELHAVFDTVTWSLTFNYDSTVISPSQQVYTLPESTSYLINFEAISSHLIEDVIIDSVSMGPLDHYVFTFIDKDYTIDILTSPLPEPIPLSYLLIDD